MKFVEGLVFLFKGLLFLDGHFTATSISDESEARLGKDCSPAGCG